ncbi:MAG: hypothetical protein MUP52_04595 [Candidatus Aminicenantes bacterium]|nr:hypothetical protein [Candidatus Aminicenantes bacterium]
MPKAEIYTWDGMPARILRRRPPGGVKPRKKKPRKKISDKGITRLTKKQRKALTNYMEQGFKGQKKALEAAGYSGLNPGRDMKRLMARKPIIVELEKKGVNDEKIATVMAEGLDAMNAMKPEMPDHHARIKFVSEANRVLDNYPATKFQHEERIITINLTKDDIEALQKFYELTRNDAPD